MIDSIKIHPWKAMSRCQWPNSQQNASESLNNCLFRSLSGMNWEFVCMPGKFWQVVTPERGRIAKNIPWVFFRFFSFFSDPSEKIRKNIFSFFRGFSPAHNPGWNWELKIISKKVELYSHLPNFWWLPHCTVSVYTDACKIKIESFLIFLFLIL
jgi:hypothetical protein